MFVRLSLLSFHETVFSPGFLKIFSQSPGGLFRVLSMYMQYKQASVSSESNMEWEFDKVGDWSQTPHHGFLHAWKLCLHTKQKSVKFLLKAGDSKAESKKGKKTRLKGYDLSPGSKWSWLKGANSGRCDTQTWMRTRLKYSLVSEPILREGGISRGRD